MTAGRGEDKMHVMIDLETLSLRPDAAIIQVAAVEFEPITGGKIKVGVNAFIRSVDVFGQSRHSDPETIDWWRERTAEGSGVFIESATGKSAVKLPMALSLLNEWWQERYNAGTMVWSHGAAFDIPILTHAYLQAGYPSAPWHYRSVRDTRTHYFSTGCMPATKNQLQGKVAAMLGGSFQEHHALYDAVLQCLQLQGTMK